MTKEMRKANARLAQAREYVAKVEAEGAKRRAEQTATKNTRAITAALYRAQAKKTEKVEAKTIDASQFVNTYKRIEIKKVAKGHFVAIADGVTLDKKFKSITAAEEWAAIRTK